MTQGPLTLEHALDISDARRAARRLSEQRRAAEDAFEAQAERAADAEHAYRKAFARAYVDTADEGLTSPAREAKAKGATAAEARDRDIQGSLLKVMQERLRGLEGERSMLKSLTEWSARMDERPAPDSGHVYGKRAAA